MAELSDPVADLLFGSPGVQLIAAVWKKGDVIEGADKNVERMDMAGNRIRYTHYGNRDSDFGWEKHHVISLAEGGPDDLDNLLPLQWEENVRLGG